MKKEQKIIEQVTKPREISKSFWDIVNEFESKFSEFNPIDNCFEIKDYFGKDLGKTSAKNKLIKDNKIKEKWLDGKDFMGIYVFIHERSPFYVGISKGIIGRITQHIKGRTHNTSTLAYKIGLIRYKLLNGKEYNGNRKDLNFETEVEPIKGFLLKQKIALYHIENPEELYLFETFCSMKLKTCLNVFETH
jgi:predicted GIY-YIG superfamily endonuclease